MQSKLVFLSRSVLMALAYGLAYGALRAESLAGISDTNWIPMAALRFTCLLFVPVRYWPALVVGESIPLGYQNYQCLELFGRTWVMVASVPRILYVIPFVYLLRIKLPDLDRCVSRNIEALLLCMVVVSLAVGLHDMLAYSIGKQVAALEQQIIPPWLYGIRRITSNYLTILTVTPLALWLAAGVRHAIIQHRLRLGVLMSALQDMPWRPTAGLLAVIIVLAVLGEYVGEAMHVLALCGVVAALVAASARYGWQSAALVGAAANLSVVALMPTHDDPLTILAQCMIAALMTCALLLGASTTASRRLARGVRLAEHSARMAEQSAAAARRLARRELFATERIRLNYANVLDDVFDDMHGRAVRMMHEAHAALPIAKLDAYYRDFEALHQQHLRITGGLAPHGWDLFDGKEVPIVEALQQIGVQCEIFEPRFDIDPLDLSLELHPALHRLKCEAVAYLMRHAPSSVLRLHLMVRMREGHRVAEVSLASVGTPINLSKAAYADLLTCLGVTYACERRLRNRAQLYGGDVQMTRNSQHLLRGVVWVADKALR